MPEHKFKMFSTQEYIQLQSDPTPYTSSWGFTIDEIEGSCPSCKRKLSHMKQVINEYANFLLVRPVGVCLFCHLIISLNPVKITEKDEYFVLKEGQWCPVQESLLEKIMKWFKK